MRRAARVDENQSEIVAALRSIGCSVLILSSLGRGCPDLLASNGRKTVLFEVKNPAKPKADRSLTPDEADWIAAWRGEVHVVETIEQAVAVMTGALAVTPEEDEAFERMGGR